MQDNIVSALILVSEKASNIARICRQDSHLLSLLVQEKKETEKNPRFVHDFKTFADVLVQEVVKFELGKKFPTLSGFIYGEESNEFQLGEETILVEVKESLEETETLLFRVLGDSSAATALAKEVHRNLDLDEKISNDQVKLPVKIAVWIDPIDSTGEYISGGAGLKSVTVLIGVWEQSSGNAVAGIINQPFFETKGEKMWSGRYIYGVNHDGVNITGPVSYPVCNDKIICVSSSESKKTKDVLQEGGYTVVEAAGAGYKLLLVATGQVSAYLLTAATTFLWDTCAASAVLASQGGGITDLASLQPIAYRPASSPREACNTSGILAYRDPLVRADILQILGVSDH